jgi:DNA transposition AAA+ family ATPase
MSALTQQQKTEIQWQLQNFVSTFNSQKEAAAQIENCSEGTISQIINGKYDLVSEKMWLTIAKQIGYHARETVMVETQDFSTLILYFSLAKENGATFAITGDAGFGKSYSARWYAANNRTRNVYYLVCAEYWNKKMFLSNLLKRMGKGETGLNVGEMMEMIVQHLRSQHQPLIILDEVDKLPDPVLKFYITLYNELNSLCGFVLLSTDAMQKRMKKGLGRNVIGYQELRSRMGSRFIELHGTTPDELKAICHANGITNEVEIQRIINEYGGDLRRVDRYFLKEHAKKLRNRLNAA